jgi:hypothetical protein
MSFQLTALVDGRHVFIPISEERYRALEKATLRDWIYLGIEEKFDALVTNYEEFEQDHLCLSLRQLIHLDIEWADMVDDRLRLGRRIANLLTIGRSYYEHVGHDLRQLARQHSSAHQVDPESVWNAQKSALLGCRVLDQLRNHIQHRSLPLGTISYPSSLDEANGDRQFSFGISLHLLLEPLAQDRKFDRGILSELRALGEDIADVVLFVREYLQGLAHLHDAIRGALANEMAASGSIILSALGELTSNGSEVYGKSALNTANPAAPEQIQLSDNLIARRTALTKRNHFLTDISKRYVTGKRQRR